MPSTLNWCEKHPRFCKNTKIKIRHQENLKWKDTQQWRSWYTSPSIPTFSDRRKARSPLPQHKSKTRSPFFALQTKQTNEPQISLQLQTHPLKSYANNSNYATSPTPRYCHPLPHAMLPQAQQIVQLRKRKTPSRSTQTRKRKTNVRELTLSYTGAMRLNRACRSAEQCTCAERADRRALNRRLHGEKGSTAYWEVE